MGGSRYELRERTPSQKSDPSRTVSGGSRPSDIDTSTTPKRKKRSTKEPANSAEPQKQEALDQLLLSPPKPNSVLHDSSATESVNAKQKARQPRTDTKNVSSEPSSATGLAVNASSCQSEQCIDPLSTCSSEQVDASNDRTQYPTNQPVSDDARSSGRCSDDDMNEQWEQLLNNMNEFQDQDRHFRNVASPLQPSIMDDFAAPGSPQYTGNYSPIHSWIARIGGRRQDLASSMNIARAPGNCFASRPPSRVSEMSYADGQTTSQLEIREQREIVYSNVESANFHNISSVTGATSDLEMRDLCSDTSDVDDNVMADLITWGSSLPRR